ncbi:MAG: UDP-N-acetylmuramate dehydrogenase [Gammaproteobacteria bacterium]|nr:UDP-N-acetylmuramate dehydrogenase [Gammaproteobacteria bacterium]
MVFNALGLESQAREVIEVANEKQLGEAIARGRENGLRLVTFGAGTNLVLGEHIDCMVLLMRARGISLEKDGSSFLLSAAAGEDWHGLVRFALVQGAFGLENLALIPGTVGAAPVQNIGAYGVELCDLFESLEAVHRESGERRTFTRSECAFGYRTSLFKRGVENPWIIWRVTLRLQSTPAERTAYKDLAQELEGLGTAAECATPVDVMEAVVRVRRRKLPDMRRIRNVGSFFKNPVVALEVVEALRWKMPDLVAWPAQAPSQAKLSAAQLIDRAGLKGMALAGARVWRRQPLVLINEQAKTRSEFLRLAAHVQAEVHRRWSVNLEIEPDCYPSLD